MVGAEQVFVAPGPDDELLTVTDLPWLAGRTVVLPEPQWRMVLAEAAQLDPRTAAELDRVSGDFAYDSDPDFHLGADELTALVRFLTDLGAHLAERGRFSAEPPEDGEFLLDIRDYVGMVDLVRRVLEESRRAGQPFRAWVEV